MKWSRLGQDLRRLLRACLRVVEDVTDPTMEEMLIIPRAEAPHLVSHYGQKLMENDGLKTASTLAAKKHRILHDPTLTANAKVALLTPVNRRLRQSKKRLRQVSLGTAGPGDDDADSDDNDMSTPAAEKIMWKLVKVVKTRPTQRALLLWRSQ